MTLFEKNVAAIRARDPGLAELLEGLPGSRRITREVSPTGGVTLKVRGTDGESSIAVSNMEALDPLDSHAKDLAGARMVALMGFASGELFAEVLERTSDQTFILLIEPDIDLFAAILRERDFSGILGKENISFAIGESPQAATFIRAEKEYGVFTLKDFLIIENRWSAPLYKSYFDKIKKKLTELKEFGRQNINTVLNLSGLWRENILTNIIFILKSRSALDLFGKFTGVPAVVVAAGPSLDKTAFQLVALKNRGIVIAVDTAVRTLLGVGVIPDIVVSLDAKYENYLHLKGIKLPDTLFVFNPSVHPMIVREHVGPSVFCGYAEPLFIWLQKVIGEKGDVRAGGSVATSAFDLAVKMGCSPVILTGQDMSYTNGQSHSSGTIQEAMRSGVKLDLDKNSIENRDDPSWSDLLESEDIFGRPAWTTFKMNSWRQWYEFIIERESPPALNATEGGLPIRGMENVSMAEAMARALAKGKKISGICPDFSLAIKMEINPVIEALVKARDEARAVKNACGKGMSTAKRSLDYARGRALPAKESENEQREMNELSQEILRREIFAETNRWGVDIVINKVEQISQSENNKGDGKESLSRVTGAFLVLFSDLYKIASDFEKSVSKALQNLKSYRPESIESLR
ncbi:hypothetical protein MNBD_NITROSPINAE02-786 [hydrothermal vent metagenome]|uniref:6-hydroxymethylpterin diphosphokinase MptE-like domain-containing protein n=1 Tax=hydrothermal vent metagenome TaxID=652676 RepID=A0A3B1CAG7_9ZZZZ